MPQNIRNMNCCPNCSPLEAHDCKCHCEHKNYTRGVRSTLWCDDCRMPFDEKLKITNANTTTIDPVVQKAFQVAGFEAKGNCCEKCICKGSTNSSYTALKCYFPMCNCHRPKNCTCGVKQGFDHKDWCGEKPPCPPVHVCTSSCRREGCPCDEHCHNCLESSCDCEKDHRNNMFNGNPTPTPSPSCKPECVHHGNPLLVDGSKCTCPCHPSEDWELEFEREFVYRYKDFIRSLLRKSFIEGIEKAKELAEDWKPAFGGETDEEIGYQMGLMAEQKLIMSKFDKLIKSL